jgi:hypothetical protein
MVIRANGILHKKGELQTGYRITTWYCLSKLW